MIVIVSWWWLLIIAINYCNSINNDNWQYMIVVMVIAFGVNVCKWVLVIVTNDDDGD